MRKWVITDPIFGLSLTLLDGTPEQYNRFICKHFPKIKKSEQAEPGVYGLYDHRKCSNGGKERNLFVALWKNDAEHLDTLNHETDHASYEMLRYVGIQKTKASEECFVYHRTWLYRECLKRLNRRRR
jgi:hypothetical protein